MTQVILDLDDAELDLVSGGLVTNGGMWLWRGAISNGKPQGVGDLSFSAIASLDGG